MENNNENRYNFDYFDKMNQKEEERTQASRTPPDNQSAKAKKPKQQAADKPAKTNGKKVKSASKQQKPGRQPAAVTAQQNSPAKKTPSKKTTGKIRIFGKAKKKDSQGPALAPGQKPRKKPKGRPIQSDPLPKQSKRGFRTAEEQQKHMRRMRLLAAMGGTFTALIIGMVLCLTVFFNIDTIEVVGASRYSAEMIIEASQVGGGQNLFTLNENAVANKIETSLPYVKSVSISRHLPGKIVIEVSDITVIGAVQTDAGWVVIGTNGKMLELVDKKPKNCPELLGAKLTRMELGEIIEYEDEQQRQALEAFSIAMESGEIDKITQIDITNMYNIKAIYDDRIRLEFGLPSDMDYKFRFASNVLSSGRIAASQKGILDLSLAVELNKVYFEPDYTVGKSITGADEGTSSDSSKKNTNKTDTSSDAGNDDTDEDDDYYDDDDYDYDDDYYDDYDYDYDDDYYDDYDYDYDDDYYDDYDYDE